LAWTAALGLVASQAARAEPTSPPPGPALRTTSHVLGWEALCLGRAALEQSLDRPYGVIASLESIDFGEPTFPEADRAAFLLGQAYLRVGAAERFANLARNVSRWKRSSVYTRWLSFQLLLAETEGTARPEAGRDSAGAGPALTDSLSATESVGLGAADALAASLRLRDGDREGALRLLARAEAQGGSAALARYLEAMTRAAAGAEDSLVLARLSSADTATTLGRDLAGAAVLRQAIAALARGEDARGLLETVPAGSRYASRALHMRGLIALERGEGEQGRQILDSLWSSDSGYVARREVSLALGAQDLDAGRWAAARQRYEGIDQDWAAQRDSLQSMLAKGRSAEMWEAWEASQSLSDALILDALPARMLADRLATASADLTTHPAADEPALGARPLPPQLRWTVPPPPAEEWRAVGEAAGRAAEAGHDLEWARRETTEELSRLEDLRRYLGIGLGRAQIQEAELVRQAARLDSLDALLQGIDLRLRAVRDEAKRRIAARSRLVLEAAALRLRWVRAMRHLHVEGPNRERARAIPMPPGVPSADSLTRAEELLALAIRAYAERFSTEAPDLIDRSYQHAWRPNLIERGGTNRAETHRLLAWARALIPSIQSWIVAARTSETLQALEWKTPRLQRTRDSLEAIHGALRAAVAKKAVERALAALDPEREAIDYGLAVAAYGLSVRLEPGGAQDSTSAGARTVAAKVGADSTGSSPAPDQELDDPEIAAWRGRAIAAMQTFLSRHPSSPARGEMRFRLADLQLVEARQVFRAQMARYVHDQAEGGRAGARLPVLSQTPALSLYRTMLKEDRDFPHLDAVLFNAGMLLADEASPEAEAFFQRLVAEHPDSRYVQEANLRMGDLRFNEGRFAESVPLYQHAASGSDPSLQAIALYKMGWAHFNGERLSEAADAFGAVMDVYESGQRPQINVDIEGEAESYLIHTLARSGGATAFADHFERVGSRPYERRVLRGLGHHFRRYSLFAEAAAAEELYLARYPLDADALTSAERLPETYQRWDRPAEARKARLDAAPHFAPGSPWAQAQTSDSVRTAGAEFARASWKAVALEHHRDARAHKSQEDWREALDLYQKLLSYWPDDPESPSYRLFAGEASAQLGDYATALRHYQAAGESGRDSVAQQAAFLKVAATDAWYESTRGKQTASLGRDSLAHAVIAAGDEMLQRYPAHAAGPDVLWRQGNLAFAHGWYERAAQDFKRMSTTSPSDQRAPTAASLEADALFRLGRYEDAGTAFEAAEKIAKSAGRDSLQRRAAEAIPVCYFRHAESVAATDSTAHARQAVLFEKVAKGWPKYEHAHLAQYRAGLAYLKAGKTRDGVQSMQALIQGFPKSEYVKDAHLQIARAWETAGEREQAADGYAAFAKAYPEDDTAPDAWLKAGDLLAAGGLEARADTVRLAYIRRYPKDVETAMEILEGMARRELATVTPERPVSKLLPAPAPVAKASKRKGASKPVPAASAPVSRLDDYMRRTAARPELASKNLLAQVRYLQGEEARAPYLAARLTQPLEKSIPIKQKLLDSTLARYRASVDLGAQEWSRASAYRIGEALVAFGEGLESSERPADLQGEDLRAYGEVLKEQSQPFYDRGEGVWADLVKQGGKDSKPDPWVARAQAALWHRLASRFYYRPETEFPLVEAERPDLVQGDKETKDSTLARRANGKGRISEQQEEDRR
jgi:TolA-binding protein